MSLRIGVALGGGGARGLAHIAMLQAFDELGVKPALPGRHQHGRPGGRGLRIRDCRPTTSPSTPIDVLANRVRLAQRLFSGRRVESPTALVSFKSVRARSWSTA